MPFYRFTGVARFVGPMFSGKSEELILAVSPVPYCQTRSTSL
ncbi:MAG: hypothetical protein R2865_14960 [Deinococcales bacterium]